ncbi:catalytic protein [Phaeosphaeriaceae sp. PMI808]|nr:catalytic protein [Phaeosphaeriaceae sp. PMI808]
MASSTSDPKDIVIVVVQGSFHTPQAYQKLTEGLKHQGYATFQPGLPSCSNTDDADFPSKTLRDDSAAVKSVVERLVNDEGKKVFVVMHSYGGLVGSNAIPKELSFKYRKSNGLSGGVFHLLYIAAFVLDEGQSVLGTLGESPNNDVKDDGRFFLKGGASLLYNDMPDDEAAAWESRLIPQSYAVQKTEIEVTAYKHIPSTYMICENDKAAPPQYQEMFAGAAGAKVIKLASGHMPMLSQPDALVEKVVEAVKKAVTDIE